MDTATTKALIIGYDFTNGKDKSILIVGQRAPRGATKIIKMFQGEEANELFRKLTEEEGKEGEDV